MILGTVAILFFLAVPRGDTILAFGRLWSRIILATAGVRVRSTGAERTAGAAKVLLCNHQSHFDIPALVVTLGGNFRMVAKRELFWIPIFGWALWLAGFIPVDRARHDRAIASLARAAAKVRSGRSVVVFAEGTRSRDGNLQPLKKGAFHLAQQAGVPLLPVTVSGSRAVLPKGSWLPRPGRIDVAVGSPLAPPPPGAGVGAAALEAAAAALRAGYTDLHQADLAPRSAPGSTRSPA